MNVWKKISALTLVLIVALALSVSAFASGSVSFPGGTQENPTDGKIAGAENETNNEFNGTFQPLNKVVNLKKDLVVYNANDHTSDNKVLAPEFSYTYTVTPVSTAQSVTDKYKVQVNTKEGILTNLTVNSGTAGTAESNSVTGTLNFDTTKVLKAGPNGATNTYDIELNFSTVPFAQSGVYRYKIEESISPAYNTLSMTDGNMNTVYLDVYVDGSLNIYGYVCLPDTTDVVAEDNTNTPAVAETTKINGFVKDAVVDADTPTNSKNGADSYYTYDITLSKTVENDNYATSNIAFPFTVFFKKDTAMTAKFLMVETITQVTGDSATVGFTGANALTESNNGWSVVAKIKSGASITYSGIPCGMDVDVYETNSMAGVTYKVTTKTTKVDATANAADTEKYNTDVVDAAVTSTTAPDTATEQAGTKAASQSTKVSFNTMLATAIAVAQECGITNTLVNISPTGVTLRYAPYLLTLGAGVTVLPLTRRYKKREEDLV